VFLDINDAEKQCQNGYLLNANKGHQNQEDTQRVIQEKDNKSEEAGAILLDK
jgi:hypothetical protein